MNLIIARNAAHLARLAADDMLSHITTQPRLNLSCATGATPVAAYEALAEHVRKRQISLNHVFCFNLDEYVGMSKSDPRSYAYYIDTHVLKPLGIAKGHARLWQGDAQDTEAECRAFEAEIAKRGGIDYQVLGLGMNGHIAFNEPGTPAESRSHVIRLAAETLTHNAIHLQGGELPSHAFTAGIATILAARRIMVLVSGAKKTAALDRFLTGPVSSEFPASFLRSHPNVTVIADRAAVDNQVSQWKGFSIHEAS